MTRRSPCTSKELENIIASAVIARSIYVDDISIKQIAEASGLAIGSIYRVIKTKSDLKKIVDSHCEALFNAQVFSAIPAKLSFRDRFSLVLIRIFHFIEANMEAANYLAYNGFSPSSLMVKSCISFASEGQISGLIRPEIIQYSYAFIWGPISTIIKSKSTTGTDLAVIEGSIWAALTSSKAA
jgi:AcrR family transcriptional regulator